MNRDEKRMYEFACALTRTAGVKLKLRRKQAEMEPREKTSQMDLVTEQDVMIETYLCGSILEKYGSHFILSEESHTCIDGCNDGYTWIIDPIDGTVNYYRFAEDYAVSLALYKDGAPVFGFVYDVANDMFFSGRNLEGAALNGCRLDNLAGTEKNLDKAMVAMSLTTINELGSMGMDAMDMLSRAQGHRYIGCASLELCKVAKGEYDLFISTNVYEWDIAAARVLIEQCGGHLLSWPKGKSGTQAGKLFAVAYTSAALWEEVLTYFPRKPVQLYPP